MHLWAYAKYVADEISKNKILFSWWDQEMLSMTCSELSKNKKSFFKLYRNYVENLGGQNVQTRRMAADHWDYLLSILMEFVHFYYDGDLKNARFLLLAASNAQDYRITGIILSSLYQKMSKMNQFDTHELTKIFSAVQLYMSCENYSSS